MNDFEIEETIRYFEGCEPTIVEVEQVYEDEGEFSTNAIYNCESCNNKKCEEWSRYND